MQFVYDGKDIASQIEIVEATITDSACGALDSIDLRFADGQGLWSGWKPQTGTVVSLSQEAVSSGDCYVDQLGQSRGVYVLRALSAPKSCKQPKSRSWEQVSLLQLAADIGVSYGFSVKSYSVQNHTYIRLDQTGTSDLEFLNEVCGREGYALKVNNRSLIIYSEVELEKSGVAKSMSKSQFCGQPVFQLSEQTYGSCVVSYGGTSAQFDTGRGGEVLYVNDIYLSSVDEAQRFAKGKLRAANRKAEVLTGDIELDLSLAGGSVVIVSDIGTADGKYMLDQVDHNLVAGKSTLQLRKVLEGY